MSFGERLKHYRLLHKMNQSDLAEKLNVTSQAVSKWENNISEPEFQIIEQITEVFKVSYDDLLSVDSRLAYQGKLFEVKKDQKMSKIYTFFTLFFSFLFLSTLIVVAYTSQLEELPILFPIAFGVMELGWLVILIRYATMRKQYQSVDDILFTIYHNRIEITKSSTIITFDEITKISMRLQHFYENIGKISIYLASEKVVVRDVSNVSEVYSNLNKLKYNNKKGEAI